MPREPGLLFEVDGMPVAVAREGLALAAAKLPVKTRFIARIADNGHDETRRRRAMTVDQLGDEVLKLKKEQFNLRFQRATGQLENTSRVRHAPTSRA